MTQGIERAKRVVASTLHPADTMSDPVRASDIYLGYWIIDNAEQKLIASLVPPSIPIRIRWHIILLLPLTSFDLKQAKIL